MTYLQKKNAVVDHMMLIFDKCEDSENNRELLKTMINCHCDAWKLPGAAENIYNLVMYLLGWK